MTNDIGIAGRRYPLTAMKREELRGVFTDALIGYSFFRTEFQGNGFVLLRPKKERKLPPMQCKSMADRLERILGKTCVFQFQQLASNERNRLIERGVYFVVDGKYVYLPYLMVNSREGKEIDKERMQVSAQCMVLYQLQVGSLDGCTLLDLEKILPFKYVAQSRAVRQLEAMQIITVTEDSNRVKHIAFEKSGYELWKEAEPLMQSPIKSIWWTDDDPGCGMIGGIEALSHYSSLNPDGQKTRIVTDEEMKRIKSSCYLDKTEGTTRIEVWKYPPLLCDEGYVDRLSLYLSLKDDKDPRVEKELEKMIEKIW